MVLESLCHEIEVVQLVLYATSSVEEERRRGRGLTLYFWTCRLSLEVSTQVTKSSMFLVTRNAGSVIVSGPTRTCPCSTYVTAYKPALINSCSPRAIVRD
jgi:hypothetical protein